MTEASSEAKTLNRAYIGLRKDLLQIFPATPTYVLDVGCATGAMGQYLRETFGTKVWGIEYDEHMASLARPKLEDVWVVDLNREALDSVPHEARYDLIVFGDILEHLSDPWSTLRAARKLLAEGGRVVTSLPNIAHWTTVYNLAVLGDWPLRSRGIHDRTHLRFFTRKSMERMFGECGLRIESERRNLRFWESGCPADGAAKLLDWPPFRRPLTFQYLHRLVATD